jgi:hypothetical protein
MPGSGDRSGVRRAVAGHAGRGRLGKRGPCARVAVGRASAVHVDRADAVSMGHAPLCNWVERGFGPVAADLNFLFSEYIQFLANSKICVGLI